MKIVELTVSVKRGLPNYSSEGAEVKAAWEENEECYIEGEVSKLKYYMLKGLSQQYVEPAVSNPAAEKAARVDAKVAEVESQFAAAAKKVDGRKKAEPKAPLAVVKPAEQQALVETGKKRGPAPMSESDLEL